MRAAAFMLTLALVAACAPESGLAPLPSDQVRARFPPGGVVNSIEIDAIDRLPLRTAELVSPDGRATPASYLHVNPSPSVTFYQRQIDTPYEGNLSGIGNVTPVPAVVIEAAHQCMTTRGVHKPGVTMVTSRMLGAFRDDPLSRREVLSMIGTPGGAKLDNV